jgi:hypothetical protein
VISATERAPWRTEAVDDAERDPEQARQPTERLARDDRPGDRAGGGDGGEVLREEVEGSGGDEVDLVIDLDRRRRPSIVEPELPRHPAAVEAIGAGQEHQEPQGEQGERHGG